MESVTAQIREGRLPEDMLGAIFEGIPYHVIERRQLAFRCACSRDRTEQAIIALGPEEIRSIIAEHETAEISCQFCGQVRSFSREELQRLIGEQH